ncbi:uncharacterized protein LOC135388480 isoform X2 [Ornithodoros turicata]|uniref:uncharacterized protein LOC135388480 isoform X2 n=1 Tax=Ornithodoros turicata TaxID=34597 RepID=UPI0031386A99
MDSPRTRKKRGPYKSYLDPDAAFQLPLSTAKAYRQRAKASSSTDSCTGVDDSLWDASVNETSPQVRLEENIRSSHSHQYAAQCLPAAEAALNYNSDAQEVLKHCFDCDVPTQEQGRTSAQNDIDEQKVRSITTDSDHGSLPDMTEVQHSSTLRPPHHRTTAMAPGQPVTGEICAEGVFFRQAQKRESRDALARCSG